jgi:hypothetical protein
LGKPYAGNPHVRFDEGKGDFRVIPEIPFLLYRLGRIFYSYLLSLYSVSQASTRACGEKVNKIHHRRNGGHGG